MVSYNLDHSSKREQLEKNIYNLSKENVEIFCFQEIRTSKTEEFIGDVFLKKLGPNWQGKFLISHDSKNDYGLGIIWNDDNLKLIDFENLDLPRLARLRPLESFIETHFLNGDPTPVKRAAQIFTFRRGEQTFRVSNIHMDWHGGVEHRFKQLEFVTSHLKSRGVAAEIICGDLNTTGLFDNSPQIKKIQVLLGSEFVNLFPKFVHTTSHFQHLDHFFIRNFSPIFAKVYKMSGSDHFPLFVSVS